MVRKKREHFRFSVKSLKFQLINKIIRKLIVESTELKIKQEIKKKRSKKRENNKFTSATETKFSWFLAYKWWPRTLEWTPHAQVPKFQTTHANVRSTVIVIMAAPKDHTFRVSAVLFWTEKNPQYKRNRKNYPSADWDKIYIALKHQKNQIYLWITKPTRRWIKQYE